MKVYEKWLKEGNWKDCVHSVEDSDLLNELQENVAKKAWRAALEEVLKQTKRTNRGRIGILDWIEKELKD